MDDPLLSTLCTICHIDPPKYTCPRCSATTCSLTCSKRHKIWSSCNGIRDPTIYKPRSALITPSGIDHDYNFLHSIEHRIERSEKVLIEDLGLVTRDELARARNGEAENPRRDVPAGEVAIERILKEKGINVIKAPKGMRRNTENTTNWNKRGKVVNWQVEWIREGPAGRALYRSTGNTAIGDVYNMLIEEERVMGLTPQEKGIEKKRKAKDMKIRAAKKAKLDMPSFTTSSILQDPQTGAWNSTSDVFSEDETVEDIPPRLSFNLYLHRVLTPSSFPKVLVPLSPTKTLTDILSNRDVLEFPTIYVLESPPKELPDKFMLEKDYLAAIGQAPRTKTGMDTDTDMNDESEEESEEDEDSSSSSNSSSEEEDSDEEMEDGEIT